MDLPTREVIEQELWRQFSTPMRLEHLVWPITAADLKVEGLSEYQHAKFLARWSILKVSILGQVLESPRLPYGGSTGLFAWDGHCVTYLNGAKGKAGLLHVLQSEAPALEYVDPAMLAHLICDTIGTSRNKGHAVLCNPDLPTRSPHYKVNETEWDRVKTAVEAPAISGSRDGGLCLRFCSIYGWMHDKQQLFSHHISISHEYELDWCKTLLARRIFSEIPAIEY